MRQMLIAGFCVRVSIILSCALLSCGVLSGVANAQDPVETKPAPPSQEVIDKANSVLLEALDQARLITAKSHALDRMNLPVWIAQSMARYGKAEVVRPLIVEANRGVDSFVPRFVGESEAKVYAKISIAIAYIRIGDVAAARETLMAARAAADATLVPYGRIGALGRMADLELLLGDKAGARNDLRAAAVLAEDITGYGAVLARVSSAQANQGDIVTAEETLALHIKNVPAAGLATARIDIARAKVDAGDMSGALESLRQAQAVPLRGAAAQDLALQIARIQMKAGDTAGAQSTVRRAVEQMNSASENPDKATALTVLARAQVDVNDTSGARQSIDAALAIARKTSNMATRVLILRGAVAALHHAGDDAEAKLVLAEELAAARQISNKTFLPTALFRVAEGYLILGQLGEAGTISTEAAKAILARGTQAQSEFLPTVVQMQVLAGAVDAAIEAARGAAEPSTRAGALRAIAEQLLQPSSAGGS